MTETWPVREGEEIDLRALNAFLAEDGGRVGPFNSVEQFRGGFSNLTYLLTGERGEAVLRCPPRGARTGTAHDVIREWRILTVLHAHGVAVPRPLSACEDLAVIRTPFYLMERMEGVILREPLATAPAPDAMRRLDEALLETLVSIHRIGPADAAIAALGRTDGYVDRQVSGWTRRWQASRTDEVPSIDHAAAWLAAHKPAQSSAVLVHNDFKFDNLVFDPTATHVRAVLDWEMATLGDPLLDAGTTLGYWVEPDDPPALRALGLGVTALEGNFTRRELWTGYLERSGRGPVDPLFYYVHGVFKIAVIAQQIYARFRTGHATDDRFARLGEVVHLLGGVALRAIERGTIDP